MQNSYTEVNYENAVVDIFQDTLGYRLVYKYAIMVWRTCDNQRLLLDEYTAVYSFRCLVDLVFDKIGELNDI